MLRPRVASLPAARSEATTMGHTDGSDRGSAWAGRYWERLLELEPFLATEVGDERFDDRLPDPSEAGLARRETLMREALRELESIDRPALDVAVRTTLDVMEAMAVRELDSIEMRFDRFMAAVHMWGPAGLLAEVASRQRANTRERRERYLRRLEAVPRYLDEIDRILGEAAAVGQTVPEVVADRTIGQVERLVATDPAHSPALLPLAAASDSEIEPVLPVLSDPILPAHEPYLSAPPE